MSDDADVDELRHVVRSFARKHTGEANRRELMGDEAGYDAAIWHRLADLGVPGLAIPERWGGSGASFVELGASLEELGRELYGGPCLAGAGFAAPMLLALNDADANERYLPGIASGKTVATLVWGGPSPLDSTLVAARRDGQWSVSGTAATVLHGMHADLAVVLAKAPHGLGVFALSLPEPGAISTPLTALDPTRRLASITLADCPVEAVGEPGQCDAAIRTAFHQAIIALACEQLGGTARVLEMSTEYALTRHQFGRPIGSFQAVKHRCADMLVDTELARSVVQQACWAAVHSPSDLPAIAHLAGAFCSEIYTRSTLINIQNHGGIGFTWEHPAHLYLKRAKTDELLLQAPWRHRAELGDLLRIPEDAP